MRKTVLIVTPWLDCPEFIAEYRKATEGVAKIIVDTGSTPENQFKIADSIPISLLVKSKGNGYGEWCNEGIQNGIREEYDVIVCLNNDIYGEPDWLEDLQRCEPGALYGASLRAQVIEGAMIPYLEGWCIAAHRETWKVLGGFDTAYYRGNYWEDNDLSFRAVLQGYKLIPRQWTLTHINNGTSVKHPMAKARSEENRLKFTARVKAYLEGGDL
jgi:GT2 family glycosyltransferase